MLCVDPSVAGLLCSLEIKLVVVPNASRTRPVEASFVYRILVSCRVAIGPIDQLDSITRDKQAKTTHPAPAYRSLTRGVEVSKFYSRSDRIYCFRLYCCCECEVDLRHLSRRDDGGEMTAGE